MCSPGRQEIPHSKILSDHFAGQEVIFLYLCCQSDKKSWEFVIKSEQMTGDQYFLSSDEYKGLFIRSVGIIRASDIIGLINLTYNLFRYEQISRLTI
jgi:hypothetical protein